MKHFFQLLYPCLLTGLCLLVSGCSQQAEVGNQAVVTGLYLDYALSKQQFEILAEIADFKGYEKNSALSTKWVNATGKTLSEAVFKLQESTPHLLYFSHAKLLILGPGYQAISPQQTILFFLNYKGVNSDITLCTTNKTKEELSNLKKQNFCSEIYDAIQINNTKSCQLYRLINSKNNVWVFPEISILEEESYQIATSVFINGFYASTYKNNQELMWHLFTQGIENKYYSTENFDFLITKGKATVKKEQDRLWANCNLQVEILDTHQTNNIKQLKNEAKNQLTKKLTHEAFSFYNELEKDGKLKLFFNEKYQEPPNFQFDVSVMESQLQKEESYP